MIALFYIVILDIPIELSTLIHANRVSIPARHLFLYLYLFPGFLYFYIFNTHYLLSGVLQIGNKADVVVHRLRDKDERVICDAIGR